MAQDTKQSPAYRYVMGDNKESLVVGYGTDPPTHAASMPASCPDRPLPCSVFSAYLTPNPNPHVLTGALVQVCGTNSNFV
jgi:Glycosyl hydrolase family 9